MSLCHYQKLLQWLHPINLCHCKPSVTNSVVFLQNDISNKMLITPEHHKISLGSLLTKFLSYSLRRKLTENSNRETFSTFANVLTDDVGSGPQPQRNLLQNGQEPKSMVIKGGSQLICDTQTVPLNFHLDLFDFMTSFPDSLNLSFPVMLK